MDINTDPEFINNYFDANITTVDVYSVPGTTWENVEYDRFNVMLVKYKNGYADYFLPDEVGDYHYGGQISITLPFGYLKRENGLVYPVLNGQIYFREQLTPRITAYKSGLKYQVKALQDLYGLLQVAGVFTTNMAKYGVVADTFRTAIQAFKSGGTAKLPGSPLPGRISRRASGTGGTPGSVSESESSGVPESVSEEADTQPMAAGERVGEEVAGFLISGDKALKGKTFERNVYGLYNLKGKTNDIRPVMQLANELIREARAAGATELRITGNVVRNPNVMAMQRIVGRFGGSIRKTGAMSIEIRIPVR
jgi:hypothetical protein